MAEGRHTGWTPKASPELSTKIAADTAALEPPAETAASSSNQQPEAGASSSHQQPVAAAPPERSTEIAATSTAAILDIGLETRDVFPWTPWCNLCKCWAVDHHLESEKHIRRRSQLEQQLQRQGKAAAPKVRFAPLPPMAGTSPELHGRPLPEDQWCGHIRRQPWHWNIHEVCARRRGHDGPHDYLLQFDEPSQCTKGLSDPWPPVSQSPPVRQACGASSEPETVVLCRPVLSEVESQPVDSSDAAVESPAETPPVNTSDQVHPSDGST